MGALHAWNGGNPQTGFSFTLTFPVWADLLQAQGSVTYG